MAAEDRERDTLRELGQKSFSFHGISAERTIRSN